MRPFPPALQMWLQQPGKIQYVYYNSMMPTMFLFSNEKALSSESMLEDVLFLGWKTGLWSNLPVC